MRSVHDVTKSSGRRRRGLIGACVVAPAGWPDERQCRKGNADRSDADARRWRPPVHGNRCLPGERAVPRPPKVDVILAKGRGTFRFDGRFYVVGDQIAGSDWVVERIARDAVYLRNRDQARVQMLRTGESEPDTGHFEVASTGRD